MADRAVLVPELLVSDLKRSLDFWIGILGFRVVYDRPEDGFAYLERAGAEVMLEERSETARQWVTGALETPFGRGINFQVEVDDIGTCLDRFAETGARPYLPIEERRYRAGDSETGARQAILQDPDGYLVRLSQPIGMRPRSRAARDV